MINNYTEEELQIHDPILGNELLASIKAYNRQLSRYHHNKYLGQKTRIVWKTISKSKHTMKINVTRRIQ